MTLAIATVGASLARPVVVGAGLAEIAAGIALLTMWRSRALIWLSTLFVSLLTIVGIIRAPHIAVASFNAVTITVAMLALGAIVLQTMRGIPSASRTRSSSRRVLP
jgi:hypothetical protein